MKNLISIICILIFVMGCSKDEFEEVKPIDTKNTEYIFDSKGSLVTNGQIISFTLPEVTSYTITISNKDGILSREKFIGTVGKNSMNIYTKVLPKGDAELKITTLDGTEIYKTTIVL